MRGTARLGPWRVTPLVRLAWFYPASPAESPKAAGLIAFYDEKLDVEVDGVLQERIANKFCLSQRQKEST